MAAYFRNDGWKEDVVLKEEMAKYVKQGLQRREMLDFLKRDFAQYAWSLRTIDRRLRLSTSSIDAAINCLWESAVLVPH